MIESGSSFMFIDADVNWSFCLAMIDIFTTMTWNLVDHISCVFWRRSGNGGSKHAGQS